MSLITPHPPEHDPYEHVSVDKLAFDRSPLVVEAWNTFRSSPEVVEAQARYTAQENRLSPKRAHIEAMTQGYNTAMTEAKITFQEETHHAMHVLTQRLQELEKDWNNDSSTQITPTD